MALLSEACAAVSTHKFFYNIFDERPIQPAILYDIGKKTMSPSRQSLLPTHKREVSNKDQGVIREKIEMHRCDQTESDVGTRKEGGKWGLNATVRIRTIGTDTHFCNFRQISNTNCQISLP